MTPSGARGFTLVEVLVALMVVALGLSALMVAVSGTARTSGYLRDKILAQWIAMNHLTEVRLSANKAGTVTAAGSAVAGASTGSSLGSNSTEIKFAGRQWHYDTRFFNTSIATMQRVVVRVYVGDAKTKGNALAESSGFVGTALASPGGSNIDWSQSTVPAAGQPGAPTTGTTQAPLTGTPTTGIGGAATGSGGTTNTLPTTPQ